MEERGPLWAPGMGDSTRAERRGETRGEGRDGGKAVGSPEPKRPSSRMETKHFSKIEASENEINKIWMKFSDFKEAGFGVNSNVNFVCVDSKVEYHRLETYSCQ